MSLEILTALANLLILPIAGMLWGMQQRLSRIEGKLEAMEKSEHRGRDSRGFYERGE